MITVNQVSKSYGAWMLFDDGPVKFTPECYWKGSRS